MRWLVLGAGALGGYFGGRLVEAGEDVTFLLRPRRLALIRANGLHIVSPHGPVDIADPQSLAAGDVHGNFDVILLGCKAYDLDSAMDAIAPAVGPETAILPFLNGMHHIDALTERFGNGAVLGGVCVISAALDESGIIHHLNKLHRLTYGELDGSRTARIEAMEQAFGRASFDAASTDHILQSMWEKWVMISTLAGSNCLLRAAVGDIVKAGVLDIVNTLMGECIAIAAANGHAPRPEAVARMHAFVSDADSTVTASMMKDVERHARVEGEQIIGNLIAKAPDPSTLRLLPIIHAQLKAYAIRREREWVAA